MKYPTVEELVARGIPEPEWDWILDENPVVAEIRMYRYLALAKFDFDWRRYSDAIQLETYASAEKVWAYAHDPSGPHEQVPPDDLTGLIPDPEDFIQGVKLRRMVVATDVENLDAFNEDGRRRAIRIGLPPDSWIITKEDLEERARSMLAYELALEPED